LVFLEIW